MKNHVLGVGGVFFKSRDPQKLLAWYEKHLGITRSWEGGVTFEWSHAEAAGKNGQTIWSPFEQDTKYFEPSAESFMINFMVQDLDGLVAKLKGDGIELAGGVDESEFGRFTWIMDPEGRKIELWEPASRPPAGE